MEESTTTMQVFTADRDRLGKLGEKGDTFRDLFRNLLNGTHKTESKEFKSRVVPVSGQLMIREAPGKTIEYRVI